MSAVAFAVGLAASVLSFVIARPLLHEGGFVPPAYPVVSLTDAFVIRAVLGTALFLALLALFALGVAAIVRHTAAAMTVVVVSQSRADGPNGVLHRAAPRGAAAGGAGGRALDPDHDRPI